MRRVWLALVAFALGCASAPPKASILRPAQLAEADAKVLQGCYDCLLEARAIYERAAAGRERPLVIQRLFEAELLIAFREREFDLVSSGASRSARALVTELPAQLDPSGYLDILDNIAPEHSTWTRAELRRFRADRQQFASTVPARLAWLAEGALSPPVRQVAAMTLDCAYPRPRAVPSGAITQPGENAPPLIRYRFGACGSRTDAEFTQLISEVPAFAEAQYFLGVNAVAAIPAGGGLDPRPLIAAAVARFPDAVAVTYLAARFRQAIGDCAGAAPLFERVIATRLEHEDAWLGRTMCLTDLGRRREAIEAATHIIDGKYDNAQDALYWRAFNRHQLGELDLARADISTVRAARVTPEILQLAGIIEHDQNDLTPAEADLKWVVSRSSGYCTAQWYLGSVYVKREDWTRAAPIFETASHCYASDADTRDILLRKVEANATLDDEYKRAQVAVLETQIRVSRHQQRAASLNAAKLFGATGDLERSRTMLAGAEGDPELSAETAEFRTWLEGALRRTARP